MKYSKDISEEKEIILLTLANKVWQNKIFVIKTVVIGGILGLIVGFSIPKEYTTTVLLIPDTQTSGASSMSSLAALAGINLNSNLSEDALASPSLYPTLLSSTTFLKGLFNIPVKDEEGDTTFYLYLKDNQKRPWWNYILKAPSYLIKSLSPSDSKLDNNGEKQSPRIFSKEESIIIESLRDKLVINSDKKTGVTAVEVTMQSPQISAYIADTLALYLQSYIIDYRTQKARVDMQYSEKLYEETKDNYYKAQAKLASFMDGNINIVSARYNTNQEKLQNEVNLAYSVYNQTAQQLQMAKIKIQNTTPVFTIIQPAIEPLYPSKPKKAIILAGFIVISLFASCFWLLRKDLLDLIS